MPPGIPSGAKILQPRPVRPNRTMHETTFQSCSGQISAVLGEEDKIQGYILIIHDPQENHIYNYPFDQSMRDEWISVLQQMPDMGEVPPSG
jgi:hypothetical protein